MNSIYTKVYDEFLSTLRMFHCSSCGETPALHSGVPGRTDILQCFSCRVTVEIARPDEDSFMAGLGENTTEIREVFLTEWEHQMLISRKHLNQELVANGFSPLLTTPNEVILPNHKCDDCRI